MGPPWPPPLMPLPLAHALSAQHVVPCRVPLDAMWRMEVIAPLFSPMMVGGMSRRKSRVAVCLGKGSGEWRELTGSHAFGLRRVQAGKRACRVQRVQAVGGGGGASSTKVRRGHRRHVSGTGEGEEGSGYREEIEGGGKGGRRLRGIFVHTNL
jgi:hypothetical protein